MSSSVPFSSRREIVYLILGAFFITNAVVAELIGGKLISIGPFTMSMGVLPWPIVFIMTDLVNEYFGRSGVRRLTFLTVAMIIFTFLVLFAALNIPAASFSPVTDANFTAVFGQSLWIIVGSITAFLVSQLIDVSVFWFFRDRTGTGKLWLRATGSTAVSQLFDTFIVLGIAFWLPGTLSTEEFMKVASSNYAYKLIIAVTLTPFIYAAHAIIDRYLGDTHAAEKAHNL
jgi:uncharacterized integral membrane protein (TIGR00697 family)